VLCLLACQQDASRAANWRHCMGSSLVCVGKRVYPLLLTQVHVLEDDDARLHIRNLSLHRCDTEEQALNMVSGRGYLPNTNMFLNSWTVCNSKELLQL
jgi:hypothetical protein